MAKGSRTIRLAIVGLLSALGSSSVHAGEPLRFSEFVAEVETKNPSVTAAELRTKAARQRVVPAGALPDPFVAVGVDEVALGRAEDNGTTNWPRPVLRYQVNQIVTVGAKRRARSDAASASADAMGASVEITRRSLRVAAAQLFLRALYTQRALETNTKLERALEDVLAAAEARYVTGGTAHHELLLARAERAVLRRDALVLRRTIAVLQAEMNELRGLPAADPPPTLVDDGGVRPFAPLSFGVALSRQPELRLADQAVDTAIARERVAKTAGLPD
ncbi:MAG: TolC family protein, partial [Myxococcales bacterium]|nr:TolC family protein [Myxococcales bacterium]